MTTKRAQATLKPVKKETENERTSDNLRRDEYLDQHQGQTAQQQETQRIFARLARPRQ
jgi:hypothetical protein